MKKTIFASVLALSALTASAAGVTAFTTYDFVNVKETLSNDHTLKAGLKLQTAVGAFDVAAVGSRNVANNANGYGVEAGYSLGVDLKGLVITGRAAYGELEKVKYYSLGVEASQQLNPTFGVYSGFRHTNGVSAVAPSAINRFTVGVDVNLTKALGVRAGYVLTKAQERISNGVMTAVSYKF